ncbi:MAG: hypothetical protein RL497_2267 [Pseudomonadota bacterium]|jgi:uncharacterized protein YbgA (DUF1722 family)/uncharacterized protein YbbK (DUF523 family)
MQTINTMQTTNTPQTNHTKIPVGISACLMGDAVRYNGGHKQSLLCRELLNTYFDFQRFCPEVAIGLGVPRQTIRLVGEFNTPRAITPANNADYTEALADYGQTVAVLAKAFSGYILMKDSPSCGLFSTKVYSNSSPLPGKRAGIFAQTLKEYLPLLPMEEEARLNDPALRENFISRVYAYHDWRVNFLPHATPHHLVLFHSRYKYYAMAHSQTLYRNLGRLVAGSGDGDFAQKLKEYEHTLFNGIIKPPSRRNHANVLYHILGYLKKPLADAKTSVPAAIKQDLVKAVDDYREALVPLIVPITLLKHYLTHYACDYINQQVYLNPYPEQLKLRNSL